MQHLTLQDVVTACRRALEDGTLGALRHESCEYDYGDGYHCAVGVALTDDTLSVIQERGCNDEEVAHLIHAGIITIKENDLDDIRDLQIDHDKWASPRKSNEFWNRENFENELTHYEDKLAKQRESE